VVRRVAAWLKGRDTALETKQAGAALARARYAAGVAGPGVAGPEHPVLLRIGGRLCTQADIESPWLHHWCARMHMAPLYHRKVWEECFVAQALWEAGMLAPRRRGLGFAVGRELLPAFLAAQGAAVLATDLMRDDARARMWHETGQHAEDVDPLFHPHLVAREEFDALVRFRAVDMAAIPDELRAGGFDFLWSVCSLEHLGSIEAGMRFVLDAMACLRPGGVAVHTTEFDLSEGGRAITTGSTVLFRRRHIEALAGRIAAAGHRMLPVEFAPAEGVLDGCVDLPPFIGADGAPPVADAPHLRLEYARRVVTSIGLVIRAGA